MKADYEPRTQRLREAAAERSADARAKAQRAITTLLARQEAISVSSVARAAGVSRDFIYGAEDVISRIREHRTSGAQDLTPRPKQERPSDGTLKVQNQVLRVSNQALRAENENLREENQALRGEIRRLQRKNP